MPIICFCLAHRSHNLFITFIFYKISLLPLGIELQSADNGTPKTDGGKITSLG